MYSFLNQFQQLSIVYIRKVFFFFHLGSFHEHSRITGLQGKGISLTPHNHFHPLHRHVDISQAITAESLPLCTQRGAGLESGTFGFRAQVVNHEDTQKWFIYYITYGITQLSFEVTVSLGNSILQYQDLLTRNSNKQLQIF